MNGCRSEALESFIEAYEGTVILTSHDKYFVERVAEIVCRIEDEKLRIVD
ncbi:hypothetical protein K6L05_04155 [Salinicoccus roseus]|nr:hypothetical protein [Salinicoccus roseus]MBY8908977.1 hypothetical protein [Salinicoccus roseus]